MIKLVMLVSRRDGISFEAFRDHYEKVHAPLAQSKFSRLRRYVRNYVAPDANQPDPPFDCMTELWFDDMAALQAQSAETRGDPELEADEALFMDKKRTCTFTVDEREATNC